jgi:site-specific recombinase XerD
MTEQINIKAFESYLQTQVRASTANGYARAVAHCIRFMGEENTYNANYQDITKYITYLRKCNFVIKTICKNLAALKRFYTFLIEIDYRKNHPCKNLRLKDSKTIEQKRTVCTNSNHKKQSDDEPINLSGFAFGGVGTNKNARLKSRKRLNKHQMYWK